MLYLVRHATPDWNRRDIPYDTPPGPPLVPQGEAEARQTAAWLAARGVQRLYTSPMLRARQTAAIIAQALGVEAVEAPDVIEWSHTETAADVRARMARFYAHFRQNGRLPTAVVSHGGPIDLLIHDLGVSEATLASYREIFDRENPLPPAGVWVVEMGSPPHAERCSLAFVPDSTRQG